MSLDLSREERVEAVHSVQRYLLEELDLDVSEMQAGFLLDYFAKEFAPFAYNKGVADARQFLLMNAEDLANTYFEEGMTYWRSTAGSPRGVRRKPGR